MTYRRLASCFAVVATVCLLSTVSANAATITVDLAQKTAVSDSDLFTARVQKVVGDQVSLFVSSNSSQPQEFVLKVSGLKSGGQDLYVNGTYKGKRPGSDFEKGAKFSVPGRAVDPVMFRSIDLVTDRLNAELKRIEQDKESEHQRVVNTLRQAADWVRSAMIADKYARSVDLIILPEDSVLQFRPTMVVRDSADVVKCFANADGLLQQARDRMYDNIVNPELRSSAVLSMTPVDLKFSYYLVNGKAKGTAVLINNCDLALSGKITPILPAGWKINAKTMSFAGLAAGKSFKVHFALTPPQKGAVPPAGMSVQAAMKLGFEPYWAKLILTAEAKMGTTVSVPIVVKPEPAPAAKQDPATPTAVTPSRVAPID